MVSMAHMISQRALSHATGLAKGSHLFFFSPFKEFLLLAKHWALGLGGDLQTRNVI